MYCAIQHVHGYSAWEVDGTNPFHEVNSQDALVTAVTAHLDQAY